MPRVLGGAIGAAFLCLAAFVVTLAPRASGQTEPTFAPQFTPAPSPSPIGTARPVPISRPDDAHGLDQTTQLRTAPAFSPAPVAPALWSSPNSSFSVPCAVHAGRLFVPVVLNGRPATFLLDTSAPYSSIDQSVAPSHSVPTRLHTLQIGALRFNEVSAGVEKIAAYADTYLGAAAEGVLGQELFARYPVSIDYRGCAVTIFRDSDSERAARPSEARVLRLRTVGTLPAIDVQIDSTASAPLVLNTGSDAVVDVTRAFAASTLLPSLSDGRPELHRATPGGEVSGSLVRARSIVFGGIAVQKPPIGILASGAPAGAAGYVGSGVLRGFVVALDEPSGELALGPIDASPPSYDRSGAWLIARPDGVAIKAIMAGSPAQLAGLQAGDRIFSVNGHQIETLDGARDLFSQSAGTTLAVIYLRGGQRHEVMLVLRSLL